MFSSFFCIPSSPSLYLSLLKYVLVKSHKHDDLGQMYLDRENRDACGFSGKSNLSPRSFISPVSTLLSLLSSLPSLPACSNNYIQALLLFQKPRMRLSAWMHAPTTNVSSVSLVWGRVVERSIMLRRMALRRPHGSVSLFHLLTPSSPPPLLPSSLLSSLLPPPSPLIPSSPHPLILFIYLTLQEMASGSNFDVVFSEAVKPL